MRVELAGIDGAGKSTVAGAVASRLGFEIRRVTAYGPAFEHGVAQLRRALGERGVEAARAIAIGRALLETAAAPMGPNVVFDRYVESARMYWTVQSIAPLPNDVLRLLPANDAVVLLDVDVATGLARRRGTSFDDVDAESAYLDRCVTYLRGAARRNGWIVIDARAPLEDVAEEVVTAVRART
ncbi:MAG TPA: hypothetical protein VHJ34_13680 [Actinomycetota bacterium]|nr:hypothetical protein [Actinomycetota bacterium]